MDQSQSVVSSETNSHSYGTNRRRMMGQFLAAAGCGGLGWLRYQTANAGPSLAESLGSPSDKSKTVDTPEDALKRLYQGNLRFSQGQSLDENRDLSRVKEVAT